MTTWVETKAQNRWTRKRFSESVQVIEARTKKIAPIKGKKNFDTTTAQYKNEQ